MSVAPFDLASVSDLLRGALPQLSSDEQRLGITLYCELTGGQPVPRERLASVLGLPTTRVVQWLERPSLAYLVAYDDRRSIVGFGGLSVVPMHHRFVVHDRTLFTWCAWDALFIPELIGMPARVESKCPQSGDTIALTVAPGRIERTSHPEAVVSFLLPQAGAFGGEAAKTMASFCHYVFFFAGRDVGRHWIERHDGTFLMTLSEAFELGRRKNAALFPPEVRPPPSLPPPRACAA